jgi:hypothetical protein
MSICGSTTASTTSNLRVIPAQAGTQTKTKMIVIPDLIGNPGPFRHSGLSRIVQLFFLPPICPGKRVAPNRPPGSAQLSVMENRLTAPGTTRPGRPELRQVPPRRRFSKRLTLGSTGRRWGILLTGSQFCVTVGVLAAVLTRH